MQRRLFIRRSFGFLAATALGGVAKLLWDSIREQSEWNLSALETLKPGDRVDLNATLPSGLKKGGTFSLDPSSTPLPTELRLSPKGILEVVGQTSWSVTGLVFSYQEP
ncbi:MAG: hypothetical protein AB7N80_05215 [Bdellovibrionales bacterium]